MISNIYNFNINTKHKNIQSVSIQIESIQANERK